MNKTVNINLGGMFFHIDEDAYQKLTRYFDAIKRSLSNSTGQDEIIKDIEMRIAEIISEKHTHDKQVINVREVDEIIAIMGQPEDYRIEDDGENKQESANFDYVRKSKKLYRDTDKGMIGGVSTGLGHYFGIDTVWIRIFFVLFVCISFGTGVVAYIVLWAVTPAAVTTAEKLEMTGEPVTISNIEKKVREEFDNVSEKLKSTDYNKAGARVKTGFERAMGNVGDVFSVIFKAFARVLGALIAIFAGMSLIGLVIGFFTLGSTSFVDMPMQNYIDALNYTDLPMWTIGLLGLFAIGIPFFFLFLLGLKLLVDNVKSIGTVAKLTLLAVWLISVGILATLGVKQATEVAFDGKVMHKQTLQLTPGDTLQIKFRYNDYYAKDIYHRHDFLFTQDEAGKDLIYSNEVAFHILKTDEVAPYLQIEKQAHGKSLAEAKKRAEKITYGYKFEGNQLILDNYLLTEISNKYRDQEVEIFLYLPKGTVFKTDDSVEEFDRSDDAFFNLHFSGNYKYRVDEDQVKCLDCPPEENDWDDVEGDMDTATDSVHTLILNEKGVLIRNDKKEVSREVKSVKINQDGITIKTE
ncbi:PspC domain-containing protein [Flavobacterium caeni]|uniref:Phage shock protein C (PspC) family protein n=1 Tax=Flavobacterium caeni TaxID=490189 RepID=A0A1G5AI78_9FLAO|nr:PspC domain-containing protein [Flavobacterium caeni]SCX77597.1 phage shock protein C (PspC) family protein [Flavobacterium caeni]